MTGMRNKWWCQCGNEYGDRWALIAHMSINYMVTDETVHNAWPLWIE